MADLEHPPLILELAQQVGVSDRSAPVYQRILVAVPALAVCLLFATLVITAAPR